jgi:ribosomal protein S18 acetylase RimI-like enzyme
MLTYRPVRLPEDIPALMRLDTSFTTDRIYQVKSEGLAFRLIEQMLDQPLVKDFPLEGELDEDRMWNYGMVAEADEEIVGFGALRIEHWNRRAAIWHLYVSPQYRRHGVGKQLLQHLEAHAAHSCRCLWLETSSVNYPGVQAYLRLGFRLVGLDTTLYDGEFAHETALYFARDLVA